MAGVLLNDGLTFSAPLPTRAEGFEGTEGTEGVEDVEDAEGAEGAEGAKGVVLRAFFVRPEYL